MLVQGKLVECLVDLDTETKKSANSVKDQLAKCLHLCWDQSKPRQLPVARLQLEGKKVIKYAMYLKKLFRQAYPEENVISHLAFSVMGLKTTAIADNCYSEVSQTPFRKSQMLIWRYI